MLTNQGVVLKFELDTYSALLIVGNSVPAIHTLAPTKTVKCIALTSELLVCLLVCVIAVN